MKNNNIKNAKSLTTSDIVYVYMLLSECIHFEHIEDAEKIMENLGYVKENIYSLPKEFRAEVEQFIEEVIHPIIYDLDYFDFLHKAEYGEFNSEGHFVINSERSLEMIIFEMYNHTIELHEKLLKVFAKYIK